jgi:hypothetical protein
LISAGAAAFLARVACAGKRLVSIFPLFHRLGLLLLIGLAGWPTAASADEPLGQNGAVTSYGLMPADHFITTSGACADCGALPQALWYFRGETIAVPAPGVPAAGFARGLPVVEDLTRWAGTHPPGAPMDYPPLVWIRLAVGRARCGARRRGCPGHQPGGRAGLAPGTSDGAEQTRSAIARKKQSRQVSRA